MRQKQEDFNHIKLVRHNVNDILPFYWVERVNLLGIAFEVFQGLDNGFEQSDQVWRNFAILAKMSKSHLKYYLLFSII